MQLPVVVTPKTSEHVLAHHSASVSPRQAEHIHVPPGKADDVLQPSFVDMPAFSKPSTAQPGFPARHRRLVPALTTGAPSGMHTPTQPATPMFHDGKQAFVYPKRSPAATSRTLVVMGGGPADTNPAQTVSLVL